MTYRYLILWYGPGDGEAIQLEQGGDGTPRVWRQVAMRAGPSPASALGDFVIRAHAAYLNRGASAQTERYMVVPLDEARQPEEFVLRASYTAEPA